MIEASGGRPVAAGHPARGGRAVLQQPARPGGRRRSRPRAMTSTTLSPSANTFPSAIWPMRWFGMRAFAAQAGNTYSAGPGPQVLDLGPLGKVLPLICYEAIFPRDVNAMPERADWMLQITNDAWFGTSDRPVPASRPGPAARDRAGAAADPGRQHRGHGGDRRARADRGRRCPSARWAFLTPLPGALAAHALRPLGRRTAGAVAGWPRACWPFVAARQPAH